MKLYLSAYKDKLISASKMKGIHLLITIKFLTRVRNVNLLILFKNPKCTRLMRTLNGEINHVDNETETIWQQGSRELELDGLYTSCSACHSAVLLLNKTNIRYDLCKE